MAAHANSKTVQVVEEIEGERIETNDYFFDKLGDAIPIMSDGAIFDVQNPPGKPLAISERFGLIFAAHSTGFCVAKTKEVIASAKEIKDKGSGRSVQELSVIDVPIGRVNILSLSSDSSNLAAVVGGEIHCFKVNSLLQKDGKPFFSCPVESDHVKDLHWTKDVEGSLVVLTGNGKLLIGAPHNSLEDLMEEVDAVGTSFDGNFVAVARKSTLSIYSSKFSEIVRIQLPLNSCMGDKTTSCTIKVDSIKWVRSDSIVVGCMQLTEDGEENYFVQVIKSKGNTIIDGYSMLAAVYFSDLFLGIVDDIVPFGCGPHLFMDYLENCELAFVANRKNTDEHIMLFAWSPGNGQVSVVHIERDKLIPRVEYQESGEENLVLGLCIEKTFLYENVNVDLGDQEQKELPSRCLLICLTLEGKLIVFNVASIAGSQNSNIPSSGLSTDTQHIPVVVPSTPREASSMSEETPQKSAMTSGSHALNPNKINFRFNEISAGKDLNSSDMKKYHTSTPDSCENWRTESAVENVEEKALVDAKTCKAGQLGYSSKATVSQLSLKDSHVESLNSVAGDGGGTELSRTGRDQYLVKKLPNFGKSRVEKTGTVVSQSTPISLWSTSSSATSGVSNGKSPFVSPSATRSALSGSVLTSTDNSYNAVNFMGKVSSHPSDTCSPSIGKAEKGGQKALVSGGFVDNPLGTCTSKMQSREGVPLQSPIVNTRYTMKGNYIRSFTPGQLNSEQESSKPYCNVQTMANELDKLLECIEEEGGFTYACTTAHRGSLETLEDGMKSLSERSRVWKKLTEERLTGVQLLLDKTVQVLAREKHMEGIVSQTNDEQYWDLWNRQKLSSELDLKRQNVLDQSQDLINQMIELEKHFNGLELNLFGESTAVDVVSRALQHRSTSSRHIQSLHTVHSATISQLAAAQHLSELLSRQMAVLNVKSPPAKQESLKKQLFDSIGISDPVDYMSSTSTRKVVEPSSNKNRSVSSSGAARNESRRNVSSSLGSHDPETARRRRDSLDRNWANFEAPRTTVKRMLVAGKGHNISSSFPSRDYQLASPFEREDSISPHPRFLTMQDSNGRKDTASKLDSETVATSMFKWAGTISETSQAEAENSSRLQVLQGSKFSAAGNKSIMSSPLSSLSFSASLGNPNVKDDGNKMGAQTGHTDKLKPAFVEGSKPSGHQLLQEKSSDLRMQPHLLSSPAKGGDIPVSYREGLPLTAAVGEKSPLMGSTRDVQFSLASGSSSISTFSRSASVVPAPNTQNSTTSVGDGLVSSAKPVKDDSNQVIQRPPSASSVSSFEAHVKSKDSIPRMGSFISSARGPLKAGLPSTEEIGAETNLASTPQPSQKIERSAGDGLKFEFSTSSTPASKVPNQEASVSPLAVSRTATLVSDMTQNTKSEKASAEYKTPSLSLSDSGFISGGKNVADAPVSHEEEMEEEAPETNETATLSLGSLAGFGIGSSPSVTTSRPNPFGAPVTSTPVSLNVPSGELFRPASFSFQSLQPSQQSQPPTSGATGGAFGSGSFLQQPPSGSGQPGQIGSGQQALDSVLGSFGQSRQLGAMLPSGGFIQPGQIGSGQAALGSVLGSFGQSRQLGTGLPRGGFGGAQSAGGVLDASTGGGFAGASPTGGFASICATAGGFAAAATAAAGGGFAAAAATGGGFAAAAPVGTGFGAFSKQGTGGFGGFGTGAGGGSKPASDLFTQMRR